MTRRKGERRRKVDNEGKECKEESRKNDKQEGRNKAKKEINDGGMDVRIDEAEEATNEEYQQTSKKYKKKNERKKCNNWCKILIQRTPLNTTPQEAH